ncbi:MAG: SRPBCC family protein, partial [Burkholderiales bacterium]
MVGRVRLRAGARARPGAVDRARRVPGGVQLAQAAGPVIRVTRSAIIDAPIERVWAVLRDFNSHAAWHPIIAASAIENGEAPDQVGCVRSFTLKD